MKYFLSPNMCLALGSNYKQIATVPVLREAIDGGKIETDYLTADARG